MARVESSAVGGVDAGQDVLRADNRLVLGNATEHGGDVERLIGDHPSRWLTLAAVWLAAAFSIGFGLFVNSVAQGRDGMFVSSLMAVVPHYFFWVLVSPAIYRALHRTIEGSNRLLWLASLIGWSIIALAGSTAMSFLSYFVRHDLTPTFEQFAKIYIVPPSN